MEERSDHRELNAQRAMIEQTMREVAVMKNILDRLEGSLFGGEGREGVIDKIEKKLLTHDKWFYIATGAIMAMQFLSGSGILSLKGLTGGGH